MIEIYTKNGVTVINPMRVLWIEEASVASRYHGIRCYIKMEDGKLIESCDECKDILNKLKESNND